ncbi:hypothetical protein D3C80_2109020 [compost metagenome]
MVTELITNHTERKLMSKENIGIAHEYEKSTLQSRQTSFYSFLATKKEISA